MRWQRLVFWSGIGLLTLIVLAIGWLWAADLGTFKPQTTWGQRLAVGVVRILPVRGQL